MDLDVWTAFAVSQTTGEVRKRWDNFIREQHHLHGATEAAKGVQTKTISKHGLSMVSEYVSFNPPDRVGMKMVDGPWFFNRFGGGWVFRQLDDGRSEATWRYTFQISPDWLAPVARPIGMRLLQRDINRRITGFAKGCSDPVVVAAATELVDQLKAD